MHPLRRCVPAILAAAAWAGEPPLVVSLPDAAGASQAAAWPGLPLAARSDVRIDGDLGEWDAAAAIALPGAPGQQLVSGWRGRADCSAQLWLAATAEGLAVAVRVRDDRHEAVAGDLLWQGDSIQIATALDRIGPEFGVALGADAAYTHRWSQGGDERGGITAAARRDGDVTSYEAVIAWDGVAGGRRPDRLSGFSILVNDNDGQGRRGYLELTPGIGDSKKPEHYALLALAGDAPAPQLSFRVPPRVAQAGDGPVLFEAWCHVPPGTAPQTVRVRIAAADGRELAAASSPTVVTGALALARAAWRPRPGDTAAAVTIRVQAGGAVLERSAEVVDQSALAAALAAATAARDALQAANAALPSPDSYASAAVALAGRAIELGRQKIDAGDTLTAYDDRRWVADLCTALAAEVADIAQGRRAPRPLPTPALDRLRIADGNFWSGDEPVMLVGAMGYSELKRDLDLARTLGFNSVGTDFASGASLAMLTGPDTADLRKTEELAAAIRLVAGKGFTWSYTPSLHYFPLWALKANPDVTGGEAQEQLPDWSGRDRNRKAKDYGSFFPFSIASPTVHALVQRLFAIVMPVLAQAPGTGVVWLMNEPRYHKDRDAGTAQRFRAFLQHRHGDLATLNARWGSAFAAFDDIPLQAGANDPGRHDYLVFHQGEVGDWFAWLGAEARRHHPGALVSSKPMAWTLLAPETGIDFEREALEWEVPGCDAGREPHDRLAAFNATEPAILLAYQRSVAPGKPLADHEYHWVHEPGLGADYSRATFLHSYLNGLRWSQFWVWATGDLRPGAAAGGAGMQYTALAQPAVLWGAARAAIDLRRAARTVAAFPQPAEVLIAFSRPTLYRDGGAHRDRIHAAFRAASGLDAPVGFATDRMLREGLPPRARLLIVPGDRLSEPEVVAGAQALLARGGTVALVGSCWLSDPYRRPLPALEPGAGRIVRLPAAAGVDAAPALAAALDPLYDQAGVSRPVRLRAQDGATTWPIECRSAQVDGRQVVALVGLAKTPRAVALTPTAAWEDVLSGESVDGAGFTLGVNDVRLLRRIE